VTDAVQQAPVIIIIIIIIIIIKADFLGQSGAVQLMCGENIYV